MSHVFYFPYFKHLGAGPESPEVTFNHLEEVGGVGRDLVLLDELIFITKDGGAFQNHHRVILNTSYL